MPRIGQVWRHATYYKERKSGELVPKYFLILGFAPSGDIIYKLLTSKVNHRSITPKCSHDDVRPGYYIGIPQPTGRLSKETWIDLRESEDYDSYDFKKDFNAGILELILELSDAELCLILDCAANAPDTMRYQSNSLMNSKAELGCS